MKFPRLLAGLLLSLTLLGCGGKDADSTSADRILRGVSRGDSLLYYVGQIRAARYWEATAADTTRRSLSQRESYLRGLEAGLQASEEDQDAYNAGLRLGLKMAQLVYTLQSDYSIDLDKEMIYRSIRAGLLDTVPINSLKMQTNYYNIIWELNQDVDLENNSVTFRSLKGMGEELGLTKIRDGLWWRLDQPGEGPDIRRGEHIVLDIDYRRANGESLGLPSPEHLTVGQTDMPPVLIDAYTRLKKGSSAVFACSANSVFGRRCEMVGLRPTNVVLIYLTVLDVSEGITHPEPEQAPAPTPEEMEKDSVILI